PLTARRAEPVAQASRAVAFDVDPERAVGGRVEVRAGGGDEAEVVGDREPARALLRIVVAVERLDAGEAVAAVRAQQLDAELVVEVRVREGHRGAGGAAERERVAD